MTDQNPNSQENTAALTPELVQQVTDKVLAMLHEDLKLAQERQRMSRRRKKTRNKGIR